MVTTPTHHTPRILAHHTLRLALLSLLALLLCALPTVTRAQAQGPATHTAIFSPRFHTLKIANAHNFMAPPAIRLNTSDLLIITFDEIAEENSWLQYRLIHCNADWQPSRLVESEYLDGFNIADIEDFAYSENTFIHFVNYRIEIPDQRIRPLVSGNYLLQVFDRDTPDTTLLQVRFMVTEDTAAIAGQASGRTDRGHNTEWQQLDLAVTTHGIDHANPYQDFELQLLQNGTETSRRTLPRPQRVEGNTLIYSHLPELIFPAGNEYRRFESISNAFPGMNVDSLRFGATNYQVWLKTDHPRALRNYEFDSTQHGRFLVREYNATDSDLGADYITVHFELDMPRLRNADIYVDGEMTHDSFDQANRMVYDDATRRYRLAIPLKQGAYNYRYLTLPAEPQGSLPSSIPAEPRAHASGSLPSSALIEGNKYETRNEYWVGLYYHPPGARADRLLGFAVITN